ncbi:MAG: DUF86 domain-containing protein [Thermodesulfovibrio sp.]|uniref:type VII toxin-antitoxin system HepT family RNase toxin n=1 Tax=unclassified Thermodesulfovibrio TaxID=2645936 RepID=UPI00083A1201|nr:MULTISPECIES: DUF86 domain-containing protein [unclassified Thermodesulfovibrio]MDI1472830.1 DUF86 domain-containing protein [Thermodesulfovibrio sp. 1176]MDI6713530.1 DUF86 domain-containing protein [Thermodesulfovibrio sp.]ODA44009.1 hypothetical protein THER_1288 [Thermodesulfovibrio sp. N1]
MIDKDFIKSKIFFIKSYYEELEHILSFSDTEIKKDFVKLRAIERIIQLIVDEIIDINTHFIRYGSLKIPESFQSSFLVLAENNILPESFAKKIAPVVGLRNRLVHRYEKIDLDLLLSLVRKNKEDFTEYLKYIFQFIERS